MRTIKRENCSLLVIDFQSRLMPAIQDGAFVLDNAKRLLDAATLLGIPILFTEQNAKGLGPTVPALPIPANALSHKVTFDACRSGGFIEKLGDYPEVVVAGCEAHVCVLQTVLGLLDAGRQVFIVRDAIGARRAESKETAIRRMKHHGAEVVTTEMVVFEWLGTSDHPLFREAIEIVKSKNEA